MARLVRSDVMARRDAITNLVRVHGAADIRPFGSVACDEADAASGVDFLVTPATVTTPFGPGGLIAALDDLLGVEVHVTLDSSRLGEHLRETLDRDLVAL